MLRVSVSGWCIRLQYLSIEKFRVDQWNRVAKQHTAPLCHSLAAGTRIVPRRCHVAPVFRGE